MNTEYSYEPSYTRTSQEDSPSYSMEEQERIRQDLIRAENSKRRKKRIAVTAVCLIVVLSFATYLFMTKVYIPKARREADFSKLIHQEVKIGDVVVFGEYEWDNHWTVADIQGSKIQLVNVGGISIGDSDGFNYDAPRAIEYWLSNDYYEVAFGEEDKALIIGEWNKRITYDPDTAKMYVIGVVKRTVYASLWIDVGQSENQ
ncbi:MAG: hypothetical protein IKG93_12845 [Clostridiales bacterium]|nr:hypothetical protein [Clostridiales bacterium]